MFAHMASPDSRIVWGRMERTAFGASAACFAVLALIVLSTHQLDPLLALGGRAGEGGSPKPQGRYVPVVEGRGGSEGPPPEPPLTLVAGAVETGGVCLDGSPPAYHYSPGFGDGADSWLVFLEGGGWCPDVADCAERAYTRLGSSRLMGTRRYGFEGIFSNRSQANPDFYNWHMVLVRYCDGGSFLGDVQEPVMHEGQLIYFRGLKAWQAVMQDLQRKGMAEAKQALLAGCSAGGIAAQLLCQRFRDLFPAAAHVKCMNDAGFFLDVPTITGDRSLQAFHRGVVDMQNIIPSLDASCRTARADEDAWQCFMAEHSLHHLDVPLFLIHAQYDTWQINNVFVPDRADPSGLWLNCKNERAITCSPEQLELLQGYRQALLDRVAPLQAHEEHGLFLVSCFIHCQSMWSTTWHGPSSVRVNNKTMAEAMGDWYFGRKRPEGIDCKYPCNPTCFSWV